jgi:hypothetical protein
MIAYFIRSIGSPVFDLFITIFFVIEISLRLYTMKIFEIIKLRKARVR